MDDEILHAELLTDEQLEFTALDQALTVADMQDKWTIGLPQHGKQADFSGSAYRCAEGSMARGRPTQYDRLALCGVSVFCLSHWRNDVTVKHDMI